MPTVRLEDVTKFFKFERKKHMAVQNINLTVEQGEFVFLNGSSGAGKSTVLRLLSGEISPDRGTAFLDDTNMNHLFGPWQIRLRRTFGVVWQEPRLIRKISIYDNLLQTARRRPAQQIAARRGQGFGAGWHAACGKMFPGRADA